MPAAPDITGVWSSDDVVLVLKEDMTAALQDVPVSVFGVDGDRTITTADASWTIGFSGWDYGPEKLPLIGIRADVDGRDSGTSFTYSEEFGETVLYAYLGDPDSDGRLVLHRSQ